MRVSRYRLRSLHGKRTRLLSSFLELPGREAFVYAGFGITSNTMIPFAAFHAVRSLMQRTLRLESCNPIVSRLQGRRHRPVVAKTVLHGYCLAEHALRVCWWSLQE